MNTNGSAALLFGVITLAVALVILWCLIRRVAANFISRRYVCISFQLLSQFVLLQGSGSKSNFTTSLSQAAFWLRMLSWRDHASSIFTKFKSCRNYLSEGYALICCMLMMGGCLYTGHPINLPSFVSHTSKLCTLNDHLKNSKIKW